MGGVQYTDFRLSAWRCWRAPLVIAAMVGLAFVRLSTPMRVVSVVFAVGGFAAAVHYASLRIRVTATTIEARSIFRRWHITPPASVTTTDVPVLVGKRPSVLTVRKQGSSSFAALGVPLFCLRPEFRDGLTAACRSAMEPRPHS